MSTCRFSMQISLLTVKSPTTCQIIQLSKIIKVVDLNPKRPETFLIDLNLFSPDTILRFPFISISLPLLSFSRSQTQTFETLSGQISISLTPAPTFNLNFQVRGRNLDDLDITSLSDPYFIITCSKKEVYRSEVIMDNLDPNWNQFDLDERLLKDPIIFLVWDKDPGSDDFIGACEVSKLEILSGKVETQIYNEKKKGNTVSGSLIIEARRAKSLAEKLFENPALKSTFIIPCDLDYAPWFWACTQINKSFSFSESSWFGSCSAEKPIWEIGQNLSISSVFSDATLQNKHLGPSCAGPGLSLALKQLSSLTPTVLFLFTNRELFDPKTTQSLIRKCEDENILVYILSRSQANIESNFRSRVFKFVDNSEEDLIKCLNQVGIDLGNIL